MSVFVCVLFYVSLHNMNTALLIARVWIYIYSTCTYIYIYVYIHMYTLCIHVYSACTYAHTYIHMYRSSYIYIRMISFLLVTMTALFCFFLILPISYLRIIFPGNRICSITQMSILVVTLVYVYIYVISSSFLSCNRQPLRMPQYVMNMCVYA